MSETHIVILLSTLFVLKHFIIDFILQRKYQYLNKGTYGHLGGLLHAGLHGLGTLSVLWIFVDPVLCILMSLFDILIHYHIDWAKVNINKKMNWGPNTHEEFWWLLGLDQLLHSLTYILIIYWSLMPI